jgi:hypothetical protein
MFDFVPKCVSGIDTTTDVATLVNTTAAGANCLVTAPGIFKARLVQS